MSKKSKEKERKKAEADKQFEKLSDIDKIRFNLCLIRGDLHLYGGSTLMTLFLILFFVSNNIITGIIAMFGMVYYFIQTRKFLLENSRLRKKFLEEHPK